jgi:glutamate dehydrogenase
MVNVHSRFLSALEADGWLNRSLEFLPTDRQIAERQANGQGLTGPEFAVLLAYTKTSIIRELAASSVPDDPYLMPELQGYFPTPLRERFADEIAHHRLRREIVATCVGNQLVNLSGISFDHRVAEETGMPVADTVRAWIAARDILGLDDWWSEVDALTGIVKLDVQLDLFLELRSMVERATLWLMRHRPLPIDLGAVVGEFRDGMSAVADLLHDHVPGRLRSEAFSLEASRLAAGVPERLAQHSVQWRLLHTGFDVVDLAKRSGHGVERVLAAYWQMFDRLDLAWLWDGIGRLPRSNRWQTQSRAALRDDLVATLVDLASDALSAGSGSGADVDEWYRQHEALIGTSVAIFNDLRRVDSHDLTTLTVAVRQLRMLALLA